MRNFTLCLIAAIALCGCATPQDRYGGDVYDASETNRMRQSDRIEIVDVLPAKINVERSEGNTGKILGGDYILKYFSGLLKFCRVKISIARKF